MSDSSNQNPEERKGSNEASNTYAIEQSVAIPNTSRNIQLAIRNDENVVSIDSNQDRQTVMPSVSCYDMFKKCLRTGVYQESNLTQNERIKLTDALKGCGYSADQITTKLRTCIIMALSQFDHDISRLLDNKPELIKAIKDAITKLKNTTIFLNILKNKFASADPHSLDTLTITHLDDFVHFYRADQDIRDTSVLLHHMENNRDFAEIVSRFKASSQPHIQSMTRD